MAPFVVWSIAGLLAALFLLGRSRPLQKLEVDLPPRDRASAIVGAICFALVVLEIARLTNGWPAAIAALIAGAVLLRRRILAIDYSIVPLFFFAFIVVEGMRSLNIDRAGANLYVTSMALSQLISNVPATILLSPLAAARWRELLYGVNAGGCGTIIASLANLLGWRIYVRGWNRDPRFFWRLTALNFAFLAWAAIGGAVILSRGDGEGSPARSRRGSFASLRIKEPDFDRARRETRRPVSTSAALSRSPRPNRARNRAAPSGRLPTSPSSD